MANQLTGPTHDVGVAQLALLAARVETPPERRASPRKVTAVTELRSRRPTSTNRRSAAIGLLA